MNTGVHVSFQVIVFSLDICPGVGLLDYTATLLVFLQSLHIVLHSICTNLYSHHYLLFVDFLIAIMTSVSWYLTVILICIFFIISITDHLFICLLSICILPSFLNSALLFWDSSILLCLFVFFHFLLLNSIPLHVYHYLLINSQGIILIRKIKILGICSKEGKCIFHSSIKEN